MLMLMNMHKNAEPVAMLVIDLVCDGGDEGRAQI